MFLAPEVHNKSALSIISWTKKNSPISLKFMSTLEISSCAVLVWLSDFWLVYSFSSFLDCGQI